MRAPQKRASAEGAPSDDDPTTPGAGGELSPEQIAAVKVCLGLKTQAQVDKFKSYFTPEEIARVKKNMNDPSKRKALQKKNQDVAAADKGFAKYNGGPQAFVGLDPKRWRLQRYRFNGKAKCEVTGDLLEIQKNHEKKSPGHG